MDITEGELVKVKVEEEAMFHETVNSDIKTEIVKEEPREENDTSKEDAKPKMDNTGTSSSWKVGDSIIKLIHSEVTVKEEEYLDSPEYMSTDTGLVECEIGQVKIENDNNVFCESIKIESVKGEPTDNEASFSPDMLAQDKDSSEDLQPGSSKESQKGFKRSVLTSESRTRKKPLQCTVCSKSFIHRGRLEAHKRLHDVKIPNTCQVCLDSFPDSKSLELHSRIHTGERPFQCLSCSKCFSRRAHLITHKRTHSGERPYKCEVCAKSFSRRGDLTSHERLHNRVKSYECEVCAESFLRRSELTTHERIHSGKKLHQCDVCSKLFRISYDLVRHQQFHSGVKPFQCAVCLRSFAVQSSLVVHQKIHTGERPFSCKSCPLSFVRNWDLKQHVKTHERKKLSCS